jgi:hypothetical protein
MATIKQIDANRQNARKSTGPRTPEGKARVSKNAITHGFTSRDIVIPGESQESFDALHAGFLESFRPTDAFEESLVLQMAIAQWRTLRLVRGEAAYLWRRINSGSQADDLEYSEERDLFPPAGEHELSNYRLGKAFGELTDGTDCYTQISRFEATQRRSFFHSFQALEARRQLRRSEAGPAEPAMPRRLPPAIARPNNENCKSNPISG